MGRTGGLMLAAAAVAACGISAVGEGPPASTNLVPDAGPTTDGAPAGNDAGNRPDAGATECASFANTLGSFTYEGEDGGYTLGADGVALSIQTGKPARVYRTFNAPKVYARTKVDAHIGMATSGGWGPDGSDYATLFQQFHGASRDQDTHTRLDLTMAQNVIELNSWATPNQTTYGLGGMRVPGSDTHLVIETEWKESGGRFTLTMNPPNSDVPTWALPNIPTTKTGATDALTVVLGGNGANDVPEITLTVFDVCVTFDP